MTASRNSVIAAGSTEQTTYPLDWLAHNARTVPDQLWLLQPENGHWRRWTWRQAYHEISAAAAALQAMGWPPGSRIAISGRNCAHWIMADLAIQWAGHVSVGLYPKQLAATTDYILQHCNAVAVFLGPDSREVAQCLQDGKRLGIRLPYQDAPAGDLNWQAMIDTHDSPQEPHRPTADSLMTLIYTSGTTGNPKGVMIGYDALAWTARAFLRQLPPSQGKEKLLSYLPLAHLLERATVALASLLWQAEIHFVESLPQFAQQLQTTAPTRFFAVPAVWQRLQAGVLENIPQWRLNLLLHIPGVRGLTQRHLRQKLGLNQIRMAVSGAAPIAPALLEWWRKNLNIIIQEGYGMTENCGYVALMQTKEFRPGSVGKPFPDANLRISAEGEIQVRHPGVMLGYFRDRQATLDAFTEDGWLKSGDLGWLDDAGFLAITGRVKDIFKTAKGKYVAPAPIENKLSAHPWLEQVCVLGQGLKQPAAVVTLSTAGAHVDSRRLINSIRNEVNRLNTQLEACARITRVLITRTDWSIDNGLLTPTLKIRRIQLESRYLPLLQQQVTDATADEPIIVWEQS